jgi:hypothetical protein
MAINFDTTQVVIQDYIYGFKVRFINKVRRFPLLFELDSEQLRTAWSFKPPGSVGAKAQFVISKTQYHVFQ